MRRLGWLIPFVFAGCSTAPIAGFLDCVAPSKAKQTQDVDGPVRPSDVDRIPPVVAPPGDSLPPPAR